MDNLLFANRVGISVLAGAGSKTILMQDLINETTIDMDTGLVLVDDTFTSDGTSAGYRQENSKADWEFTIRNLATQAGFDPQITSSIYWVNNPITITFYCLLPTGGDSGQVGGGAQYAINNAKLNRARVSSSY